MTNWQEVKFRDIASFKYGKMPKKEDVKDIGKYPIYSGYRYVGYADTYNIDKNQLIVVARGVGGTGDVKLSREKCFLTNLSIATFIKNSSVNVQYLYYYFQIHNLRYLDSGSAQAQITISDLEKLTIPLPPLDVQKKIAGVLGTLDDKIELNNKINNNLEQQVQALFNEMFLEDMVSVHSKHHLPLSELVQNIDNRGKTPPLSPEKTDFPIIDVKALSGNTRIINYDNCTKFVSQETYLTGFRNGLPQKYDILLSTVGSLGEMKLFIEPKGCIAQNVIGYRSKISPLYLYQYLKTIKNDLLAYDIGSVQPSIKVTHIAKHPILVPDKNKLKEFHGIAEAITNKIYINSQENTQLSAFRDTLLPKLMSGEIDVSKVDINKFNAADMLL